MPPPHLGLVSAQPFAVLGVGDTYSQDVLGGNRQAVSGPSAVGVTFSYNQANNTYQISLPNFEAGTLAQTAYKGTVGQVATSTSSAVRAGPSTSLQPVHVFLQVPGSSFSPYSYTSFGSWDGLFGSAFDGTETHGEGIFVYGIPTQAGDMPITGSASYTAKIVATLGPSVGPFPFVGGDVSLLFDFAGGTLSGFMHPQVADDFDGIFIDYGQYDFKQTVYSTGSTTFSGKFDVPGLPNADSFFDGNFTGPQAAELMARFVAPYLKDGQQGTISGIWIGKKN